LAKKTLVTKKYCWLSFVDPHRPKGKRFLGACIVEAVDVYEAIPKSHRLRINPGGAVQCRSFEADPQLAFFKPDQVDVLYSESEMREMKWI
jgi:hypothetical protein